MLAFANPEIFLDGRVTQYCGDVRAVLARLPSDHFDCVVTSPPYWGLRDYGVAGQLGLERSLGEHLAVMVEVFREVRRVLKPSGTLWLNYGDCYATAPNGRSAADTKAVGNDDRTFRDKPFSTVGAIFDPAHENGDRRGGPCKQQRNAGSNQNGHVAAGGYLKPKDLCMVPNRLAIALQDDGWWVRSEIIWHKPNPMPESTRDRPTSSHEKIWLLTKSERYYYDADAVAEQVSVPDWDNGTRVYGGVNKAGANARQQRTTGRLATRAKDSDGGARPPNSRPHNLSAFEATCGRDYQTRNARNVWSIGTSPFPEAHFATFPPELAERCIKAGSPPEGRILDPFGGAGTTALVAASLGRIPTLIDLNPEYCRLARARIESAFMGKDEGSRHMTKQLGKTAEPGPLFAGVEA